MSGEDLFAKVLRQPSQWQVKQVDLRTAQRGISSKVECSPQCWLKSEPCGDALSRGSPAENRREASLNQESAEWRTHAGVGENSVAILAL